MVTMSEQNIHPAATLILLREAEAGPEVLLVRRSKSSRFMGGVHVFPGGKLDEADRNAAYARHLAPFDLEAASRRLRTSSEETRALHVAALREAFEEAGALLAARRAAPEALLALWDESERERLAGLRRRLHSREDRATLLDVIAAEDLILRADRLVYFDHWITPEIEPKRFDTRFFAAEVPEGQDFDFAEGELTELRWMRPADALAAYDAGEIQLAPPTWTTLWRLTKHASVGDALGALAARAVPCNLPRPRAGQGSLKLVLPGHPEYGPSVGEEIAATDAGPIAFLLSRGRWHVEFSK